MTDIDNSWSDAVQMSALWSELSTKPHSSDETDPVEKVLFRKFMDNFHQLKFRIDVKQATAKSNFLFDEERKEEIKYEDVFDEKSELRRDPAKAEESKKTVCFRGKEYTKGDIEDLFDRNESRKPNKLPSDTCCYE